jgi:hypothetical protein
MKPLDHKDPEKNGVLLNVDPAWQPRLPEHRFFHPIGQANPDDTLAEHALNVGSWFGDAMLQVAPFNRMISAAALTAGMFGGAVVGVTLAGQDYNGDTIKKANAPALLRPLHGLLEHNPTETDLASRTKRFAVRYAIPAAIGGAAVWAGSRWYLDSMEAKEKNDPPQYLEDYATAILRKQAKPWGVLSATTSLLASASGASVLPFNYGVAVNTQTSMERGHRMMLGGIGDWYTNNPSSLPFGTAELEKFMIKYESQNPSLHPERTEELWGALVLPHFPKASKEQIQRLVDKTFEIRDPYMQRILDGEDAKTVRTELEKTLTKHFTKDGLWSMLNDVGLDPAHAILTDNGFSGRVGDTLGMREQVDALQREYQESVYKWKASQAHQLPQPSAQEHSHPQVDTPPAENASPSNMISQPQHNYLKDRASVQHAIV